MTDELSIDAPQFREIVLKENPDGTWECAHGVFTSCTKCSKKAQDARAPSLVKDPTTPKKQRSGLSNQRKNNPDVVWLAGAYVATRGN